MSNAEESVAADELRAPVARRGKIKGQITRFTSFLSRANSAVSELQDRLEKIECVWTEFDDVQTKIEFIDDSEKQEEYRAEFEDTYYEVVSRAKGILADAATLPNSRMQGNSGSSAFNAVHSSGVQLPSINLPKFDGRYDKWMAFKDAFDALIDKNKTLANVQKFFYLKLSVTGVASEVIADLEATDSNYNVAWKLLQDRFENRKLICHTHVKAIFELPTISKEASSNLQRLVDDFQKNIRALNNLGEPSDQWSTLLVYLVSSKLDIKTQKEWIRESSKLNQPTIKELMQFLTERCHFL
ncbi:uncharacterized protein LOC123671948 [Harmonia axyridis]|uniref:uncharacterized protein LOC123671948 n=1 Tax=Harmonia axyridis TaxID=115357 RepID=UPI001E278657|nr:uncharacterized protein LOC123671948 [Harmonia axyridis]